MNNNIVIRARNIGKLYYIGSHKAAYQTLRDKIVGWVNIAGIIRRKDDSRLKKNIIWALKDISFEVKRGEILGIIGCNGAGKTTLLKVLSRITEPTEGFAEICGRVGSLLEVGTGFHPELTGRENIFLNGAIIGMKRLEIKRKFDEIVAFAGIEKFIDTPLKHYSSGMYVRLAFAVAAHLQPEILLLDEVLAVGDFAFQKRCFEKMGDVVKEGRTIILVSHNLQAINSLCSRSICLEDGRISTIGETREVVDSYLRNIEFLKDDEDISMRTRAMRSEYLKFLELSFLNSKGEKTGTFFFREPFEVRFVFEVFKPLENLRLGVGISASDGLRIFTTHHTDTGFKPLTLKAGRYVASVCIQNMLIPGRYILAVGTHDLRTGQGLDYVPEAATFRVLEFSEDKVRMHDTYNIGFVQLPVLWQTVTALETKN